MTIAEIEEQYGRVQEGVPGAWAVSNVPCPNCKTDLEIEIDMECEGGVFKDRLYCLHCLSTFRVGYYIPEPEIVLEPSL